MIIVLDTNIWLSELGLHSSLGAATRFFIKQNNARIALPEVVRLETEHNLRNKLREHITTISNNHRKLLTVFGKLKEVVLPDNEAIEKKVADLFSNLGLELIEIPFTLESARKSFIKTVDGLPPSGKGNQQFKDGVLWADCVELLKADDIYLVTDDKVFFKDRDHNKGLALNLAEEIENFKNSFRLFSSLAELLPQLRTVIPLDEQLLTQSFIDVHRDSINNILNRNGFELGQKLELIYTLYATEQPQKLYIEFDIDFEARDQTGGNRENAVLKVRGDGTYNSDLKTFEELRNFGEKLIFKLGDGSNKEVQNHVIFAGGIVLGHKEVEHTVRYKLD